MRVCNLCLCSNNIVCPAEQHERTGPFAGNSSARRMSLKSSHQHIPSKILSSNIISYNFIYNVNGIFESLDFNCSRPSAGTKQSVHIVSFPARHTHARPSAGHKNDITMSLCVNVLLYVQESALIFALFRMHASSQHINAIQSGPERTQHLRSIIS